MAKNKAIFFDRDGIVNYRIVDGYVSKIDEFHFIPDFFNFFESIKKVGFLAILVSNQQGVGKGIITIEKLAEIHKFMQITLEKVTKFKFDDIYVCTELAQINSYRRKPNPGMILEAINKWNIERTQSWMIGDSISDVIAGKRAGINTILISSQNKLISEADKHFDSLIFESFLPYICVESSI